MINLSLHCTDGTDSCGDQHEVSAERLGITGGVIIRFTEYPTEDGVRTGRYNEVNSFITVNQATELRNQLIKILKDGAQ